MFCRNWRAKVDLFICVVSATSIKQTSSGFSTFSIVILPWYSSFLLSVDTQVTSIITGSSSGFRFSPDCGLNIHVPQLSVIVIFQSSSEPESLTFSTVKPSGSATPVFTFNHTRMSSQVNHARLPKEYICTFHQYIHLC